MLPGGISVRDKLAASEITRGGRVECSANVRNRSRRKPVRSRSRARARARAKSSSTVTTVRM